MTFSVHDLAKTSLQKMIGAELFANSNSFAFFRLSVNVPDTLCDLSSALSLHVIDSVSASRKSFPDDIGLLAKRQAVSRQHCSQYHRTRKDGTLRQC